MRKNKIILSYRFLRSYPNPNHSVQFNGQGTRLLCQAAGLTALALYNLKSTKSTPFMQLTAPDLVAPISSLFGMSACFAGKEREFVIGSCYETSRVYI